MDFNKLNEIAEKLIKKHLPESAKGNEESKEILAFIQYYKIHSIKQTQNSTIAKTELIERMEANNRAFEYAAYNYDGSILEELNPNVIESTGVGTTCLIEVRENKRLIEKLNEIETEENTTLPNFLYENNGEIRIGFNGDTIVTEEWNSWLKANS